MSEYPENNDYAESTGNRPVFMVGAFPPPVHGMAAVNSAVRRQLVEAGADITVINVAAKNLERSLVTRFGRLPQVARGLGRMLFSGDLRGASLYMSISGGLGQVYEIFFLLLARLRGMQVFLHHHCFAYLDQQSWITHVLTTTAGQSSVHITLSTGMAARLHSQYYDAQRVIPISNTVFVADNRVPSGTARSSLKTIGFISNLSAEKGIFDFLDLVAAYEADGLSMRAKIAGPCQDAEIERKVMQRLSELNTVEYLGPQYGDDKESFFEDIDVLIFPTRYVNEAEPLIIHEAMQCAIPVIAYGRGCIPEIVGSECGLVIDPAEPFTPSALVQIKQWLDFPDVYKSASHLSAEHFTASLASNAHRWHKLLKEILGDGAPDLTGFQTKDVESK